MSRFPPVTQYDEKKGQNRMGTRLVSIKQADTFFIRLIRRQSYNNNHNNTLGPILINVDGSNAKRKLIKISRLFYIIVMFVLDDSN